MSIALLVIHDGREDYLERTVASASEMLPDDFVHRIVIDDSDHQLGFAGAIQEGWDRVLATDAEFVFHLEADFTFTCPVPLAQMCEMVRPFDRNNAARNSLCQVALKRQAWNDAERAAGGICELRPDAFEDVHHPLRAEHRLCFTTNPSVYPRFVAERGWPQVPHSEGIFTHQLLADGYHFAYLGGKFDPPRVLHIGEQRAGVGY